VLWAALGLWVVRHAPFASGTDESISYVAFAAAKNRWATEEDFHSYGIDGFYYPPLYFLCFAPFYGDDPAFVEEYPRGEFHDPNYLTLAGRTVVSADYLARVPPSLDRLYRHAKLFSLSLGLVILLCLAATLRLLLAGPSRWWMVLLGTTPLLFLPQFLYYQTLCNNDTLVNALSALAVFSFVGAICSLEDGRRRRFVILSLTTALFSGLALLTKMSGFVPLALLPFLAAAHVVAPGPAPLHTRVRHGLWLLLALLTTTVVGGGWWLLHKAGQGDWDSMKAQLVAHPWAFGAPLSPADPGRLFQSLLGTIRSYYAIFNGFLDIGVPDSVCTATLLLPILWCVALAAGLIRVGKKLMARGVPFSCLHLRTLLWSALLAVFLFNAFLVALYLLRGMDAGAYGRLLFPSLVPTLALFAGPLAGHLSSRPRRAALAGIAIAVYCGGLFWWTFSARMVDAVAQPREDLRILFWAPSLAIPLEAHRIAQPISLSPGKLTGFRVQLTRSNLFPQFGATLEGTLRYRLPGGSWSQAGLRPVAIGDFDNCRRWVEISLFTPVGLPEQTEGLLSLIGRPPLPPLSFVHFSFLVGDRRATGGGQGAILDGTTPTDLSLCLAAVYQASSTIRETR
jgi:hypothetical protein